MYKLKPEHHISTHTHTQRARTLPLELDSGFGNLKRNTTFGINIIISSKRSLLTKKRTYHSGALLRVKRGHLYYVVPIVSSIFKSCSGASIVELLVTHTHTLPFSNSIA